MGGGRTERRMALGLERITVVTLAGGVAPSPQVLWAATRCLAGDKGKG